MSKKTISRDIPLSEITLRRYEKPAELSERELVRKFCLSVGLLQPGDSRDVVVDVLYVLLKAKIKKKKMSVEQIKKEVINFRKENKLPLLGIASSNIRRQVKRLKDIHLVEAIKNEYRICEYSPISELFDERISKFLIESVLKRVKEYCIAIDERFFVEKK